MRNWTKAALLAAAFIAPASAQAQAVDGIDAFVSVAAGYNNLNAQAYNVNSSYGSGSGPIHQSADGLSLDVRGSIAVPVTHLIGAQVDADFDHTVFKTNEADCRNCAAAKLDDTSVTLHGFVRDPKLGLIGLVAQRTSTTNNDGAYGQTAYFVGGEGQYYFGPVTAYAQVTYGTVDSVYYNQQGINLTGQLRYYMTKNLMLETKAGYERFTDSIQQAYCIDCDSAPLKSWMVGAKAEYQLANKPISFSVDYEYRGMKATDFYASNDYFYDYNGKYHDSRLMFGVKVDLGHRRSLLARDRSGASLDPVDLIAMQARSVIGGNDID